MSKSTRIPLAGGAAAFVVITTSLVAAGCGASGAPEAPTATTSTVREAAGPSYEQLRNLVTVKNALPGEVSLFVNKVKNADWGSQQRPDHAAPEGFQDVKIPPGKSYSAVLHINNRASRPSWQLSIVQRATNYLLGEGTLVAWKGPYVNRGSAILKGFVPDGAPFTTGPHAFPTQPGIDERITVRIGIDTTVITIAPPR
jgi:hypothetical protein